MAKPRSAEITLYHAPNTRSLGALTLLEELGVPYRLHVLNLKAGEQHQPAYLAINPMGKVPALLHGDAVITEQAAVFMYLADLYPEAGLAPPIGDPLRGPYLRWMVFYGSCFEPALADRALQRAAPPRATSPYADFDTMFAVLEQQLARGPYLLGTRYSAADVLWAGALRWTTGFKLVPATPAITAYLERVTTRPAFQRARAEDAKLAAVQSA